MISIKKRGAVYGVIGLMLCIAIYLNWSYFQSPTELTVASQTDKEASKASGEVYGAVTAVSGEGSLTAPNIKSEQKTEKTDSSSKEDSFAQARLSRQTARDKALSLLKETISDKSATQAQREEATSKISSIAANSVKEAKIEGEIQNKGFTDAVVYIEDGSISASVYSPKGKLNQTDVAKIADIIVSETGAELTNIKISDKSK